MKSGLIFALIIIHFSFASFAQQSKSITNFISDESVKNAAVSVFFADASTGERLVASEPQTAVVPASVLKLVTSATALEILGKDFRFTTWVAMSGKIENHTLNGDLIVIGGGDPTLGSTYFNTNQTEFLAQWIHSIKLAGIDSITGNIVADNTIYADQDVPQNWLWEDIGSYYGAAAQGISVFDNSVEISFQTSDTVGIKSTIKNIQPNISGLIIDNQVVSGTDNRDRTYIFGSPTDNYRLIKGSLPKGKTDFKVASSLPDPAMVLASLFQKALQESKVFIAGTIEKRKAQPDSILLKWESPALSTIIRQLNFESINLYAEHFLKQLGLTAKGEGSTAAGIKTVTEFWKAKGIDTKSLFVADGSGLSRFNAITAKTLVDILVEMKKDTLNFSVYEQSIPLTGLEGTMINYFQNSEIKGKAHVKSGSMTRVRCLSGYMPAKSGRKIAFAILVNNFSCTGSEMARKMERLMEEVYASY